MMARNPPNPRALIRERVSPEQILEQVRNQRNQTVPERLKGYMLCGERVTKEEFNESTRTGIPPARILRGHNGPDEQRWKVFPKPGPEPWD